MQSPKEEVCELNLDSVNLEFRLKNASFNHRFLRHQASLTSGITYKMFLSPRLCLASLLWKTRRIESESESHSVVSDFRKPPHRLYSPWSSPGQNTRVGNRSLLQGIFPIQESNPGLLHCRQILYQLSYDLLLLSRFSRVRLCATTQTAAHQAPPSLGFSRQ